MPSRLRRALCAATIATATLAALAAAQPAAAARLLAVGTLAGSSAGAGADLSGLTGTLENGAAANMLAGTGSALAWAGGDLFLGLPDRGPNAVEYNKHLDDTATWIPRVDSIRMALSPAAAGAALPMVLTPRLEATTLLWSATPLAYGSGEGMGTRADGGPVGSGAPAANSAGHFHFSGRSDNFDPSKGSDFQDNARLDSEGLRVSNDGKTIFVSDEYGPYLYAFDRASGRRLRAYRLPGNLYVAHQSPHGPDEVKGNSAGRTANRGMEGLAITPDGKTLLGAMQSPLVQDGRKSMLLRLVRVDIASGATAEFAYKLDIDYGVSEMVALNDHEFLLDERDGTGLEGGKGNTSTPAKRKILYKIDIAGATDVTGMDATAALAHAVKKSVFLDMVTLLHEAGIPLDEIPSKIEGVAFGADVTLDGQVMHTLWLANDNDFLPATEDKPSKPNPNRFYVIGFTDADLAGSAFVPQAIGR